MTRIRVVFSRSAEEQLIALYRVIAASSSPQRAADVTEAIVTFCEGLCHFPNRGTSRDDVRPGLRITNFKRHTVIAFSVDEKQVSIVGIFYRGRDYEMVLRDSSDEDES